MSEPWYTISWASCMALSVATAIVLVVGWRRTGNRSLLLLGLALVVWPLLGAVLEALRIHFVNEIMRGQRPWLFPYTLMGNPTGGFTGWQTSLREFRTKLLVFTDLVHQSLILIAVVALVRSLRKEKTPDHAPEETRKAPAA